MINLKSILILILALTIAGCASVIELYDKGKYDSAFDKALKKLYKDENKRENKEYLNKSFSAMVQRHLDQVNAFNEESKLKDVEKEYKINGKLNEKYQKAKRYLYAEHDSSAIHLSFNEEYLRNSLVDGYVLLAENEYDKYEKSKGNQYAINAHQNYLKALKYESTDEMVSRADEILKDAHTLVSITLNNCEIMHDWKIDNLFGRLASSSTYVTYEIGSRSSDPDCKMLINFGRLDDNENVRRNTEYYEERIIDHYETETDTSGVTTQVPVYETVRAEVELREFKYTFEWDVNVDLQGDCLNMGDQTFSAEVVFEEKAYSTHGDERALPINYQMNKEKRPKGKGDFETKAVEELLDELYGDIRRHYF